ncbi:MAG: carboxy-S-adenosyl-L-methionine synthase CmoA [Gammaproteobacteria bacterium]|nr:carboxy-S-adenosyl-L-methionine synthase CmoA [Gammaproteobacteria bacterium]
MSNQKDLLYSDLLGKISDFSFDESVASVFPDMIKRSVPGYGAIISMIGMMAGRYVKRDSNCYDLGCSLGATTLAMRKQINQQGCRIIAVDNSDAMVDRCKKIVEDDSSQVPVEVICRDIQDVEINNASIVVLNFTLQFIDPEKRQGIINKIYKGMLPGGILVISEKLSYQDKDIQNLFIDMHHEFKKAHGYSDLEISQKRTALEEVLIPEDIETHKKRILKAGFSSCDVWFQCFNFASLLALK